MKQISFISYFEKKMSSIKEIEDRSENDVRKVYSIRIMAEFDQKS